MIIIIIFLVIRSTGAVVDPLRHLLSSCHVFPPPPGYKQEGDPTNQREAHRLDTQGHDLLTLLCFFILLIFKRKSCLYCTQLGSGAFALRARHLCRFLRLPNNLVTSLCKCAPSCSACPLVLLFPKRSQDPFTVMDVRALGMDVRAKTLLSCTPRVQVMWDNSWPPVST